MLLPILLNTIPTVTNNKEINTYDTIIENEITTTTTVIHNQIIGAIKLSMPFISLPLIYICNKMLSTGTFPTLLKFSQVYPIFKMGNKTKMSDYRPVSLLTSFSIIFEKVIYNRLLQHTKENNIIAMYQYGFKLHLIDYI